MPRTRTLGDLIIGLALLVAAVQRTRNQLEPVSAAPDRPLPGLEQTGRQVITQLTRLPDLTAGRTLAVEISVTDSNGSPVTAVEEPADARALCGFGAIGNRHLHGKPARPWTRPHPLDLRA